MISLTFASLLLGLFVMLVLSIQAGAKGRQSNDGENIQEVTIPFDITETGANTFTQLEIQLPVEPASGLVFDLEGIDLIVGTLGMAANTLGNFQVQWTHSTQTAILAVNNKDIIAFFQMDASNNSANAGFYTFLNIWSVGMETRNLANYIADRSVFVGIKGLNQAGAKRVSGILRGKLRRVSKEELTSLVLNQLA